MNQWTTLLDQLEKQVVEGQHLAVKRAFHALQLSHIPDDLKGAFAELAWRSSEHIVSLKILSKTIFPENEFASGPTDREKLIYATALGNLGAVNEALQLFDTIEAQAEPEVWLRKSLVHFRVWNYPPTIAFLKKFLAQENLADYRRLIGQVNLAAALVVDGQFTKAEDLLADIQSQCEKNQYLLLLGNSYELRAQIQFFQKDYEKALSLLEKATELLKNQGGEFLLFTEKWQVFCHAFKTNNEVSLQLLRDFRLKASEQSQWETVRECDLFESLLTNNDDLARKVILGTPFEYYRQRARRVLGKNILPQGGFHWFLESHAGPNQDAFLFNPYEVQNDAEALHTKPQLLALFEALTMDFYKTSHIGLLFQRIYKDEKFNPFTSPKRILKLIKRLDQWFEEHQVPLRIQMKKSEFALKAREGHRIQVFVQRGKTLSKQEGNVTHLREIFKDRSFSSQNVADKLQISKASAQNLLQQALTDGMIIKRGSGRGTTYALAPRNRKKMAA